MDDLSVEKFLEQVDELIASLAPIDIWTLVMSLYTLFWGAFPNLLAPLCLLLVGI
jgi:hypothetical protein